MGFWNGIILFRVSKLSGGIFPTKAKDTVFEIGSRF
jgi:hypothetical protein